MPDSYGPFDGLPWAEADWHRTLAGTLPSGVIGDGAAIDPTAGALGWAASGLTLTPTAGTAIVGGAGYNRTAALTSVTGTANSHATFSRRDRLVLRRSLATHNVALVILPGTAAASPAPPALTRNATTFDLSLFSFLVPPNSGTALTGVVDERFWVPSSGGGLLSVWNAATLADSAGWPLGTQVRNVSAGLTYEWNGSWLVMCPQSFYSTGTGGSAVTTTIGTPGSTASVTVPPGTWDIDYRQYFSLSVSSARALTSYVYQDNAELAEASLRITETGVVQSQEITSFVRATTTNATTTFSLRVSATAVGGTQNAGTNIIRVVRAA